MYYLIFTNYILFNILKISKIGKENINLSGFSTNSDLYY